MGSALKSVGNIFSTGKSQADRFARQQEEMFRQQQAENQRREAEYSAQRTEQDARMNMQMEELAQRQKEAATRQENLLQMQQESEIEVAEVEPGSYIPEETKRRKRVPLNLSSALNL